MRILRVDAESNREHVLPNWLAAIGHEFAPHVHHVGPLNKVPRECSADPFRTTVRMVCSTCNRGRLSDLEGTSDDVAGRPGQASGGVRRLVAAQCGHGPAPVCCRKRQSAPGPLTSTKHAHPLRPGRNRRGGYPGAGGGGLN